MSEAPDFRERLAGSLDGIDDSFLTWLREEVFTIEKLTTADCPHCGKSARVRTPDVRSITAALATLADQGKGKAATASPPAPKEASEEDLREAVRKELGELGVGELARLAR